MALSILVFAVCLTLQRYLGASYVGQDLAVMTGLNPEHEAPLVAWWGRMYWAAFKSLSYVAIPVWLIKRVWKESPRDHGLRWHHDKRTYAIYGVMIFGAVLIAAIASGQSAFVEKYPLFKHAANSPGMFWSWFLAYGFQFACLEFFFRGALLFVLVRRFGYVAIFVAVLPYSMIHFTKPALETLASMAGGIALGTLSLRTRSIYGGMIAHCMIAWSMDLCALWHQGLLAKALGFGG